LLQIPCLSAKRIDAAVNIMSVIKGKDMTIYSVAAESPRIHAIVNKEGACQLGYHVNLILQQYKKYRKKNHFH
jgi:hypothetical protein